MSPEAPTTTRQRARPRARARKGDVNRERQKAQSIELWQQGQMTQVQIADQVGISQTQVSLWVRGITRKTRTQTFTPQAKAKPVHELSEEAKRGLAEFSFFRERYLGRGHPGFQEPVVEKVSSGRKRLLFLWPPTFGKSQMCSIDYVLWRICQNRDLRVIISSRAEDLVKLMLSEIKENLTDNEELIEAYGEFYDPNLLWRQNAVIVAGRTKALKDPTVQTTSAGKHVVGRRCDLLVVDDLCDGSNSALPEKRQALSRWFHTELINRLEPGVGVAVVVGTRFSPHDLYGELRDATNIETEQEIWETTVFRAHDETKCGGKDNHTGYPDGCLLWPERMTYADLIEQKSGMTSADFDFVYQQMDVPAEDVLVRREWIYGGRDSVTGSVCIGCLDKDRGIWELPSSVTGRLVVGIDPSAENWSVFTAWLYQREKKTWWLLDMERRRRLQAPQYTQIMDDWWCIAQDKLGRLIDEYTMETVGAFRFLLQDRDNQEWRQRTGAMVRSFETTIHNKYDPEYGVTSLRPDFEHGRIRLPYRDQAGRSKIQPLIDEALTYPHGSTTDCIMSMWFPWVRESRKNPKAVGVVGGKATSGGQAGPVPRVGTYWSGHSKLVRVR